MQYTSITLAGLSFNEPHFIVKTMFLPFVQEMQPFLDQIKLREDELRLCADMATMKRVMGRYLDHCLSRVQMQLVS